MRIFVLLNTFQKSEKTLDITGDSLYNGFCVTSRYPLTGCGSVWLEYLVWDQGVAGSNPVTPMKPFLTPLTSVKT